MKSDHEFCKTCLADYIKQKILSNQLLEIKCPDDCGKPLEDDETENILTETPDLYKRFLKFKNIALLSLDPNIRWCVRAECEGYIKRDKNSNKLICGKCNQAMCFLCRNAWHEAQTCEEAMKMEFKKYIERVVVKECPKCKSKIEKSEGCNHMSCSRCNYQFCWLCLKKYSQNHYKSYNLFGCPGKQYYSRPQKKTISICWFWFWLTVIKCLFLITGFVLAVAVAPFALIFGAIYLPCVLLREHCKPKESGGKIMICWILLTILIVILFPIIILLVIMPGS